MKKFMSSLATPFVFAIVAVVTFVQPACTGIYHEAEMPQEMMK